jgi:hypothetical protein
MFEEIVSELGATINKQSNTVEQLLNLAACFGIDRQFLETDLKNLLCERLLFWILGEVERDCNFFERLRSLKRRIEVTVVSSTDKKQLQGNEPLLEKLARLQASISLASQNRREGVHSLEELSLRDVYSQQNHRCAVCGVPIHTSARTRSNRFQDGIEPVVGPHLDHILPFYLLGNGGGMRILCHFCNQLKADRIGTQEDGFVISGNHFCRKSVIRQRMAFWTLNRFRKCQLQNCGKTSADSVLFVQPRLGNLFTYGNLICSCADHASESAFWLHEGNFSGSPNSS